MTPTDKVIILFIMFFMHIIADYTLQGILASMKSRRYMRDNYPASKNDYDHIMALYEHAFMWTFLVMAPAVYYQYLIGFVDAMAGVLMSIFLFNMIMHAYIDDLKANRYKINLIQDQMLHIYQIVGTWISLVLIWR